MTPEEWLVARARIHDTVLRYCRAVDRGDLAGVRAVYTADGVDHHTGFDGGADAFVAWLEGKLAQFDGTMHLVGNHLVEFVGADAGSHPDVDHGPGRGADAGSRIHPTEALAETYGTAVHWGTPRDDPERNFTSGFRYVDHLRFEGGRWLIASRTAVREWTRSDAGRLRDPEGPGPRGSRTPADPLPVLRARLTIP